MISKHLHRDDKVRVLKDLFDSQTTFLSVTAGSLGTIISFQDYYEYIKNSFDGKDTLEDREKHFSKVCKDLQKGRAFIVKVESFAPVSDTGGPSFLEEIVIIESQYLEELQ
jgi:hypothetical protein